jgi:hypothetical protein
MLRIDCDDCLPEIVTILPGLALPLIPPDVRMTIGDHVTPSDDDAPGQADTPGLVGNQSPPDGYTGAERAQ